MQEYIYFLYFARHKLSIVPKAVGTNTPDLAA